MQSNIRQTLILEVKGNSLDDGPGIRTVIFFKGCPLSCAWCHNPESRRPDAEISFSPADCVDCGACVNICPEQALSKKNRYYIDRKKCTLCFKCVEACPSGALERVGRNIAPAELAEMVLRDRLFFENSGGGVTLSGGEPLLFMEYVSDFLSLPQMAGLHVLAETAGLFKMEKFRALVYPHIKALYFDIKLIDPALHKKFCGVDNSLILANFAEIFRDVERGFEVLPRVPLVPGISDSSANLKGIADFLGGLGVKNAALLPYNPLWHEKCGKLGLEAVYRKDRSMTSFMDRERIEECRLIFTGAGIDVSV